MTPMNHEKFRGNQSARFSEIRNTDTQIDRWGNFIYIYRKPGKSENQKWVGKSQGNWC